MRLHIIFAIVLLTSLRAVAQSPKREVRAVWLTTVANIDFPSKKGLSSNDQKKEIIETLDTHRENGINTIVFQVRPCADAFYESELEPWSKYLNGQQGVAPQPAYDPLAYIIDEAHKRNMELHAWINPFRVRLNKRDVLSKDHPYAKHPEWGWDYNNKTYFDPGVPEVREHTIAVIRDIVKRYDVDGIHFDDYFYPYRSGHARSLPDKDTFNKYKGEFEKSEIDDWRRNNVNTFIKEASEAIKEEKAWVKFGISPFGIWKNSETPGDGLPTKTAASNYDMLYADIIKWQREGWIDYCAPQLYWAIGYKHADFAKLLEWWNDNTYGRHMYIGHGLYKVDAKSKEKAWQSYFEIEKQLNYTREMENISGNVYYSSKHLTRKKEFTPLCKALKENYYRDYALLPLMPWIDNKAPKSPAGVKFSNDGISNRISWKAPKYKDPLNKAYRYIVYKTKNKNDLRPETMVCISTDTEYNLPLYSEGGTYFITCIDRMHNESKASEIHIKKEQLGSIVFRKDETFSQTLD